MTFNPLSVLVLLCGIVSTAVAVYAWRRRSTLGAQPLGAFMASMSVYIIGYSLELTHRDLAGILFWSKVEYIGILTFPTFYLIFAMQYTGRDRWLNRRTLVLLFVIPAALLVVKFLDERLHLIYASAYVDMAGALPLLAFTRGPLYLLTAAYNLATVTLGNYWLVEKRSFASRLYRRQTTLILAAAAIIYVVYGYYLTGVPLIPSLKELDLNPLAFAVWGIAIVVAIFRYGLFELAPIARDALIEMLSDGVIVLDTHSRLVDANPAAQSIFGWRQVPVGQPAEKVMEHWIDEKALTSMDRVTRLDVELSQADETRFYGAMISPLMDKRGLRLGYLMVVHDISERKAVERRLHELSLVDDLTGLTNRRGFNMLAAQLFGMARRMGLNAALFFIDLDGLKQINDRLGHAAGDQALKDTALILKGVFRSSDIVARFGGDEFVVLAVETLENSTEALLARVRDQLQAHNAGALRDYALSFSIGLARDHWAHPRSMDTLLAEADQAMYAAKQASRSLPEPPA